MRRGPGPRCRCAHGADLHRDDAVAGAGGGSCRVELPPFVEEELPAWRCPCTRYAPAAAGPWLWHPATQSWAARGPRTAEPAA